MSKVDLMEEGQIEALAKVLGECGSSSDISRVLEDRGLGKRSGHSAEWKRLYWLFLDVQKSDRCANRIHDFIGSFLAPARFVDRPDEFEGHRAKLNTILAFSGFEYGSDGQFRRENPVQTIDEAQRRAHAIRAKFRGRRLHPEVLKYCQAEMMEEYYFHAVFEASKGLAQRIRDMAEVGCDGGRLVDVVFSINKPLLAMSKLQTETERSEHKGFAQLLKGCFGAIRNPLAHEPRILWKGEDDAVDYLSLISLLHWKLDDCFATGEQNRQ